MASLSKRTSSLEFIELLPTSPPSVSTSTTSVHQRSPLKDGGEREGEGEEREGEGEREREDVDRPSPLSAEQSSGSHAAPTGKTTRFSR